MNTGHSPGVVITAAMGNPLPIPLAKVTVDAGESGGRIHVRYIHVYTHVHVHTYTQMNSLTRNEMKHAINLIMTKGQISHVFGNTCN